MPKTTPTFPDPPRPGDRIENLSGAVFTVRDVLPVAGPPAFGPWAVRVPRSDGFLLKFFAAGEGRSWRRVTA